MSSNQQGWKRLFLFCGGLFAGTAFCMKWMEGDLVENGRPFTIIGLEISYPKERVMEILAGLDERVRTILRYHLHFDFAFMAGVYPGIAALCMQARQKLDTDNRRHKVWRTLLGTAALLQVPALVCDVVENCFLLGWINKPVIGNEFAVYHAVVYVKWLLALAALLLAVPLVLRKKQRG